MAAALGYAAQLGVSALGDTSITTRLDFASETLRVSEEFPDTTGVRGTRSRVIERVRAGNRRIRGNLTLQPTALEMVTVLPWAFGGTPSGTSYPLADALSARNVMVDRNGDVHDYSGCKVNVARFRASQGGPLEVDLDVVGIDEDTTGTFPVLSIDVSTGPFILTDLVLSVNSTTVNAREFELTVDNRIDTERFFNSRTLTAVNPQDRQVTTRILTPYGDAVALYNTGAGGVAVVATFTNGTTSLAFTMVKVAFPRMTPTVPGRSEVMHELVGTAYRSASTLELTTVLDSTP